MICFKRIRRTIKRLTALAVLTAVLSTSFSEIVKAEIFYLPTGRRLDTNFYANYYPDLKAKYGYDAHKLLNHYLDYGMFERRIPSMYYLGNMDALAIGDLVPCELLYERKSLVKGCTYEEFELTYKNALRFVNNARAAYPNNMLGQMQSLQKQLYEHINFNPGIKYRTRGAHYNDAYGVLTPRKNEDGSIYYLGGECSATTRAMGLCLNMLAIPYEHVNENQWKQQWCRVNINGVYYALDPYLTDQVLPEVTYVRLYPPFMP